MPDIEIAKPKYGAPCNGCGICCQIEPCLLAQDALDCHTGPCKALEVEGDRTVCGLVRRPAWYLFGQDVPESETGWISVMFANLLGLGVGCDASDDYAQLLPRPGAPTSQTSSLGR